MVNTKQQEEEKARRKIKQTQVRAHEMLALKQRNLAKIKQKQVLAQRAQREQELVRSRVLEAKKAHKAKLEVRIFPLALPCSISHKQHTHTHTLQTQPLLCNHCQHTGGKQACGVGKAA